MNLPIKPIHLDLTEHDYIARIIEIKKLIRKGMNEESLAAIETLENDMQIVLAVGELHDSVNCLIN